MSIRRPEDSTTQGAELREFETLLSSVSISRAPNLHHFLEFIGTKYFEGKTDEIKEYTVAVHALNRGEDFDPRADSIVRVTAVALRKRLEQYYTGEGATHAVHLELPPGQYVPRFVHRPAQPVEPIADAPTPPVRRWRALVWLAPALMLVAYGTYRSMRHSDADAARRSASRPVDAGSAAGVIRFLPGDRAPYADGAGQIWQADTYCTGGRSFQHSLERIHGTDDPALFVGGREGRFECRIPVPPGTYEVHLYFAETAGGTEATRDARLQLNGGPAQMLDVVNDAGAPETATERLYMDVEPLADGAIHVASLSDDSFVNAIEILPGTRGTPLPLRFLAGRTPHRDDAGRLWLTDRFFFGGRRTYRAEALRGVPDQGLFQWERFGHFRYHLPVVPGHRYRLTLYFSEAWFNTRQDGTGGVGSRVFDVYCNGTTLLQSFDILEEDAEGVVVKTFRNVKPTAQGKLELSFTPVVNYPLVNAIEVAAEE